MRHRPKRHQPLALLCACLMLAACGADKTAAPPQPTGEESLPKPDAAGGSVTGMPDPGTPAALPPPADNLATDAEVPAITAEGDGAQAPELPVLPPSDVTLEGSLGKPPPDTMPVMPAHPPEETPQSESEVPPPPLES
jgi:hypothetical protein